MVNFPAASSGTHGGAETASNEYRIDVEAPAEGPVGQSPTNPQLATNRGTQAFFALKSLVNKGIAHRGTGYVADLLAHVARYQTINEPYAPTRPMHRDADEALAAMLDNNPDIASHEAFAECYVDVGADVLDGPHGLGDSIAGTGGPAATLDHWLDGALASDAPTGYLRALDNDGGFGSEVEGSGHAGLRADLERFREDTGTSNVNMGAIAFALSAASGENATMAQAALAYLRGINVIDEIRAAIPDELAHSSPAPDDNRMPQVPQETKDIAWRTLQLIAESKFGMEALKAITKKDDNYAFYEPVLTVFLRGSKKMVELDPAGARSPTPQSVLIDHPDAPRLLKSGLLVAAKRLKYDIGTNPPKGDGTAKADDQPDLANLSSRSIRDFALLRCGYVSDEEGTPVAMADKCTSKASDEWVERAMNSSNMSHKSPMSSLTEEGMRFASQGGVGEYKGMGLALSEMRNALRAWNDGRPTAPPATPELRATMIRDYVREAILEIWSSKMLWEFKDGIPFNKVDVDKMKQQLQVRVQGGSVEHGQSASSATPITIAELEHELARQANLQATPELMRTWWTELKEAAGEAAHDLCANETEFNSALNDALGQRPRNAPLPENFEGMSAQEGREAIAESVAEMWSGFALGSSLKVKDGHVSGAESKNFLYHAWAIAGGEAVVQVKPKAGGSRARHGEVTFAVFGDGASISIIKKTASSYTGGAGVFVGKKFTVLGQRATGGGSVDPAYLHETARSEGVIYRLDREGLLARGNYKGRPGGLFGDAQLVQEMGEVAKVMILGPTPEEKADGMTAMDKMLSTFPDSLSITILTPEDDSETTTIRTISLGGGAAVNLGRIGVGPAVSLIGGQRISDQIRDEKGDGVTIQRKIHGVHKQVSVNLGAGAAAVQPITDTEVQGIGSGSAGVTWDLYLDGSKSQDTVVMVNRKLTSGSHKLVGYATFAGFEASIMSRIGPLSEQLAERKIRAAENALAENNQQLSEGDRRSIVAEAKQHILGKLKYFKEENTATQNFLEYQEVSPAAVSKLNELYMLSQIAQATNPPVAGKCQVAMDQVLKDPGSWVTMFGLNLDGLEQVEATGANAALNRKKQKGQFASKMKNFLVFK